MAPPGGESLYVLVPVPHLGRGIDWNREAQPFRDRIVHFLEHDFGLTGLQSSQSASSTASHRSTFRTTCRAISARHSRSSRRCTQSAYFRPHNVSEDIDSLYLVGAGTHPGAGIPGVLLSAKITSNLVNEALAERSRTSPSMDLPVALVS